jgi:hypothetical protein
MSDAEFAGIGIIAGIAVMFVLALMMFWFSNNSPPTAPPEVLQNEANNGIGIGLLAVAVLGVILALLLNF